MKIEHTIVDSETRETRKVTNEKEPYGVSISPDGLDCDNGPIYFEWYNGKPILHVWSKGGENVTHTIDLGEAIRKAGC